MPHDPQEIKTTYPRVIPIPSTTNAWQYIRTKATEVVPQVDNSGSTYIVTRSSIVD